MGKVENLPKWAQGEIRVLEMRLREARERLDVLGGEVDEETKVIVNPYDDDARPLLPRDSVRFKGTPGGWVDVSMRDGVVLVRSSGRMKISPDASNSVTIWDWETNPASEKRRRG